MDYIDNKYQLTPGDYRVTNVTPFTYRDGYTYLQLMEEMRSWVSEGLVNQFSAKMQGLASDYNQAVSRLLVDVRKEMEGYHALPPKFARCCRPPSPSTMTSSTLSRMT